MTILREIRRPPGAQLLAAAGDADKALALIGAIHRQPATPRAERHYRSRNGTRILGGNGPVSHVRAEAVAAGRLIPVTGAEVDAYLEGRLDGNDS